MSETEISDEMIMCLLETPIAYSRIYPSLTGSATASILLGQAFYWFCRTTDKEGWFWKSNEEWCDETGLSEEELYGAKKRLDEFLEIDRRGMPPKMYYRVKLEAIKSAIRERRFKRPLSNRLLARIEQSQNAILRSGEIPETGRGNIPLSVGGNSGDRSGEIPETTSTYSTSQSTVQKLQRGSRARAKAPQASEAAISFVKAFRERFPHYPSFQEPKQIAKELAAAEYLLKCGTTEEHLELAERVLSGFPGNRRKAATVKDLWENLTALRAEHSDLGAKAAEIQRVKQMIENLDRPKTEAELIEEWQDYTNVRIENGNLPDYSAAPECVKRAVEEGRIVQNAPGASGGVSSPIPPLSKRG